MQVKSKIFCSFVNFLKHKNVEYCILGNTTSYPALIGSDVDVVISENSFKHINIIIDEFCTSNDFHLCNCLEHEITGKYFVIAAIDRVNFETEFLAIDVCSDYNRDARLLLHWEDLLADRILFRPKNSDVDFYICNNTVAFLYYFVKKIEKLGLSRVQFDYLSTLWRSERQQINIRLRQIFSLQEVDFLNLVFDQNRLELLHAAKMDSFKKSLQSKFKIMPSNLFREVFRLLGRIIRPTGVVVAFMGCDGSGKSTIINKILNERFHYEAFRDKTYYHLYPKKSEPIKSEAVINPHAQNERSYILSNLKLIYFFLLYTVGYWRFVFPKKIKSNLVTFDRYYHDILIDTKRYRHGGGPMFATFVSKLIPKPDVFFFIDAPVSVIMARKQEVSVQEATRQRAEYLKLAKRLNNGVIIENTGDPRQAAFNIEVSLIKHLATRHYKRNLN